MTNNIIEIDFSDIPQLSEKDVNYQKGATAYKNFYKYEPNIQSFKEVIQERLKFQIDRTLLVEELKLQYKNSPSNELVENNILSLIKPNTFTITTAHQPVLLLGPLYVVYKIISTIHLCRTLSSTYPDYNFIPIFVSGGEDHDLEEVATTHLFGKSYTWNSSEQGATGRMSLDGLQDVINEITQVYGSSTYAQELEQLISNSFNSSNSYGEFSVNMIKHLYNFLGLVVLNMDNKKFKEKFLPYALKEIKENLSAQEVRNTQNKLADNGVDVQAHVRDINLFYLGNNSRDRIIENDGKFEIGIASYSYSKLSELLVAHPENISPNVVMRPLYQEIILPNLAYIGGGGEIAYWLERKSQFEAFSIPFPMLIRRNSVMIVSSSLKKNMEKINFQSKQFFMSKDELTKEFLKSNVEGDYSLQEEINQFEEFFASLAKKGKNLDSTLEKYILAEGSKQVKVLKNISSKMTKVAKQQHETQIIKIQSIKDKLFPNGSLQERHESFIQYYLKYGKEWFNELMLHLDPMNKNFLIIEEKQH